MVNQNETCIPFLEKLGFVAASPQLRSSMLRIAISNPFAFYFHHRLGITSRLSWSKALSHGSWAHKAAECLIRKDPNDAFIVYSSILDERLVELRSIAESCGYQPTGIEKLLERERLDAYTAWSWMRSSRHSGIDWLAYVKQPKFDIVAVEPDLSYHHELIDYPVGIKPDIVLYHREHKTIWLGDYKTTSKVPSERALYCPRDFQTQLYIDVAQKISDLTGLCGLPRGLPVKGMSHFIIEKPSIEFGLNDRDYSIVDFTPSKGKNKGITRQEKVYEGEPRLKNYVKRVANWYGAMDDYVHLNEVREEPPVNISHSPTSKVLDANGLHCYHSRLKYLCDMLTRPAYPLNFLYNPQPPLYGTDIATSFANFDIMEWPTLISKHRLMTRIKTDSISLKESLSD